MENLIKEFRTKISRKAIVLDIGGFRPSEDPLSSYFGKVSFCKAGEDWPISNVSPMIGLAQINITEFPHKPYGLEDIAFLTIFIDANELLFDEPNGTKWLIRTYKSLGDLKPINALDRDSRIKPLPVKPREVAEDFPCWEDLPIDCPDEIEEDYYDLFENIGGFKFGGWPSLLQSEIYWSPWNKHQACPEYVFQIDSTEKANWTWGDNGVGYFGRGTAPDKNNEWALAWQCC